MFKARPLSCGGRLGGVFSEHSIEKAARPISYHFPICLETTRPSRAKNPFKFGNMWLEFEGFSNLIK